VKDWYHSSEFEMPLWVLDLDDQVYSVAHRRLCVWLDELDGSWHWEIQTYDDDGVAAADVCASEQAAKDAAVAAVREGVKHGR